MPLITLATKAAQELLAKSLENRDQPEDDNLEEYFSPASEIRLHCTTEERECFESDTKTELTQDCFEACPEFKAFFDYLNDHECGLEVY